MNKYEDMLNIKYESKHKRMSIYNRSAQFSPFSALTGYNEAINEINRVTLDKIELSDYELDIINKKINYLKDNINNKINIKITYYIKDNNKDGGIYKIEEGIVKNIDDINKFIKLDNNLIINFKDIINIDIKAFDNNEQMC